MLLVGTMNLAESMKYVLKNKGQNLFSTFWKEDVKIVLKDMKKDMGQLVKSGSGKIKEFKKQSLKETVADIKDSALDAVTIFRILPSRIKQAFIYFREDLLKELEDLPEQKDKTIFCLKIIGVLSSFTLTALYGAKKTRGDLSLKGLKRTTAFTQMLAAELVMRVSQVFVLRFISEVESQMSDDEELKKLRYFKSLLSDGSKNFQAFKDEPLEEGDAAVRIVESLRTFILTGVRA